MYASKSDFFVRVQRAMQTIATTAITLSAFGLTAATLAASFGVLPWPEIVLGFGGTLVPMAGAFIQIGLTAILLLLVVYLPTNTRVLRLETSHRNFRMSMEDVARAYAAAHAADRSGAFTLKSEFDAVRERLEFLRTHPDLGHLEPEILEIAAQMSRTSEELADIYSDDKIARARAFLSERMTEAEELKDRITRAETVTREIRRTLDSVELEENVVASRLERLRGELAALLPDVEEASPLTRPAKPSAKIKPLAAE